jgi:hypothetical protein
MPYTFKSEQEVKNLEISIEDTVSPVPWELGIVDHAVVDSKGTRSLEQDHLFTYFSGKDTPRMNIVHAPKLVHKAPRAIEPVRDNRERISIHSGDKS